MNNLPYELQFLILSYSSENDYCNIRLVCMTWKKLFNKIWNTRRIKFNKIIEYCIDFNTRFFHIEDFKLYYVIKKYRDLNIKSFSIINKIEEDIITIKNIDSKSIKINNNNIFYKYNDTLFIYDILTKSTNEIKFHTLIHDFVLFNDKILIINHECELYEYDKIFTKTKLTEISKIKTSKNFIYVFNGSKLLKIDKYYNIIKELITDKLYYDFFITKNNYIIIQKRKSIEILDNNMNEISCYYFPYKSTIKRICENERLIIIQYKKSRMHIEVIAY